LPHGPWPWAQPNSRRRTGRGLGCARDGSRHLARLRDGVLHPLGFAARTLVRVGPLIVVDESTSASCRNFIGRDEIHPELALRDVAASTQTCRTGRRRFQQYRATAARCADFLPQGLPAMGDRMRARGPCAARGQSADRPAPCPPASWPLGMRFQFPELAS
jgi:hypothetical protein